MASTSLLGKDIDIRFHNVPPISDRAIVVDVMRLAGLQVTVIQSDLFVNGSAVKTTIPMSAKKLRVSMCYAVALAVGAGRCISPLPGGDAFSKRPVDLHLKALELAGARCMLSPGDNELCIEFDRQPQAIEMSLNTPFGASVGATVSAMLIAARAEGISLLRDISTEPEVLGCLSVLRQLGIKFLFETENTVSVHGHGEQLSGSAHITVPPDRMEAGTYLLMGLLQSGSVKLDGIGVDDFPVGFQHFLKSAGAEILPGVDEQSVFASANDIYAVTTETAVHPGLPTDLQPQISAFLTQAVGKSRLTETIYERRTSHIRELAKLGISIDVEGSTQLIAGPQSVHGGSIDVADIRCGAAALVLAGRSAESISLFDPDGHLARGYSHLDEKLELMGFEVERSDSEVRL